MVLRYQIMKRRTGLIILALLLVAYLAVSFFLPDNSKTEHNINNQQGISENINHSSNGTQESEQKAEVSEDGLYSSKEEVALYIHLYGHLPDNYITKSAAKKLGWVASQGNLWEVTDHKSIGGSQFQNSEGLLPSKKGRQYYECDIDYQGGTRNGKRIVYSNDGLVYYTEDHYSSFELLYGEP